MTTDKTPATLAVDVLAVMARDAASAFEARHGGREIQEFLGKESDAARAAVTELIEASAAMNAAAKTMQNAYRKGRLPSESSRAVFGIAKSKVDAAIARVKGESA